MCDSTVGKGVDDMGGKPGGEAAAAGSVVYRSAELFRGSTEIIIRHDNSNYRLRITRQGKLILNK